MRTVKNLRKVSSVREGDPLYEGYRYLGFDNLSVLLQIPFLLYGNIHFRVTHAVSRRQEYTADELAARLVGSRPFTEGLKLITGAAFAFDRYWSNEVVPLLRMNRYPSSITKEFCGYLASPQIAEMVSAYTKYELAEGQTEP